jgi:hypothetical protein
LNQLIYVGSQPIEERNLCQVVGWHESYLNSAVFGYEQGTIRDWISFLREAWALPLYHDKFAGLARLLRTSLVNDKGVFTLLDKIFEVADHNLDDQFVSLNRKKILGDRGEFLPETTFKSMENYVMEFIKNNKATLTGMHIPHK